MREVLPPVKYEATIRNKRTGYTRTLMFDTHSFRSAEYLVQKNILAEEEIIKIEKDYEEHG